MITVTLMPVSDRVIGRSGDREEWAAGWSEAPGEVGHRKEWATGRSGLHGGVGYREK